MMIKMSITKQSLGLVIAGLFCNSAYAAPVKNSACKPQWGYARLAVPSDLACVDLQTATATEQQNADSHLHFAYDLQAFKMQCLTNPNQTTQPYYPRHAVAGDEVCVLATVVAQAQADNIDQPNRLLSNTPSGSDNNPPSGTPSGGSKWDQLGHVPAGVTLANSVRPAPLQVKMKTVTITADQIPANSVKCAHVDVADNRGPSVIVTGTPMLCFAHSVADSETIKHDYTDTVSLGFINPHFKILPMGIKYMVARQGENETDGFGLSDGQFRLIDAPFDKSLYENSRKDQWGANGGVYIYGNANMIATNSTLTLTHPMWQNHTSPSWGTPHRNEFVTGSSVSITVEGPANEDPIKR